jgi:hypothetical protein
VRVEPRGRWLTHVYDDVHELRVLLAEGQLRHLRQVVGGTHAQKGIHLHARGAAIVGDRWRIKRIARPDRDETEEDTEHGH